MPSSAIREMALAGGSLSLRLPIKPSTASNVETSSCGNVYPFSKRFFSLEFPAKKISTANIRASNIEESPPNTKRCLRCNTLYQDEDNSPTSCLFHGHATGERGLFALAPPHQGIDGEWSDGSGVIVYRWNAEGNRPNTGKANWKKRWSCCQEYDENAPPCRRGWHVCYDDGFTLF